MQLIAPSLKISDISEVKKLLYMSSSKNEQFIIRNQDKTIIMSDYWQKDLYNYIRNYNPLNCPSSNQLESISPFKYLITCSPLLDPENPSRKLGELFSLKKKTSFSLSPLIIYIVAFLIVLFLILFSLLKRMLVKLFLNPVIILKQYLSNCPPTSVENISEKINTIPYELYEIKSTFDREYLKRVEAEKYKAIVDIIAGLCHDIRSPLACLELCISEAKTHLPNPIIEIQYEAIKNIRSIANNVLEKYRVDNQSNSINEIYIKYFLLSSIIETVVSQKRYEWRHASVDLDLSINEDASSFWLESDPNEIKRVLSNLINNAYEALQEEKGQIKISMTKMINIISVCISDNGKGIHPQDLERILKGYSTKHLGKGLGVSTSKQFIERMGGSISISSTINVGTKMYLDFPISQNPTWFPEYLLINSDSEIIVLDDDTSIHSFWKEKLKKYTVKVKSFFSEQELLNWHHNNKSENQIFIMDYQLGTEQANGLELLKIINPEKKGYLITSFAEDINLQNEISKLNSWLFPKKLLGSIKIHFNV